MNINLIKPTAAIALADLARSKEAAGQKIIKLQTGDPDFATHEEIIFAAERALRTGNTHYSYSQGLPSLRSKIAEVYNEKNVNITEKNVIITHGAAEGFFAVISSLIDPNDEVLILEPNWPTVDSLVLLMGGKPVKINSMGSDHNLINELESNYTANTRMLCINTPNNPTGKVLKQEVLRSLFEWAKEKKIYFVVDEVYNFLQFEEEEEGSISFFSNYSKYIYLNSFSKKFAMTGWRIGYVIAESDLVQKILKPSQLAITHVAPFIQIAALEALSNIKVNEYCKFMRDEYALRRKRILEHCDKSNISYVNPQGAFYVFIRLPECGMSDTEFCNRLLNEYLTCVVPGSAFGSSGKGYIRISIANRIEEIILGIENICRLLGTYNNNKKNLNE